MYLYILYVCFSFSKNVVLNFVTCQILQLSRTAATFLCIQCCALAVPYQPFPQSVTNICYIHMYIHAWQQSIAYVTLVQFYEVNAVASTWYLLKSGFIDIAITIEL